MSIATLGYFFAVIFSHSIFAQVFEVSDPKSLAQDYMTNSMPTPLYDQIEDELNREYQAIGEREARRLLQNRSLSIIGGLNSVGVSFKKPFLDFTYFVDRNLAPDLFDDKRWIVTDTMSVTIDASKIFGRLKNEGKIDLTEKNLNAFAGLVFKRSYTYVHFANSYEEGLMRDFEKLFFPFRYFSPTKLKSLSPNEFLIKEDSLSFNVGGLASAPLYSGITGMAGFLAKYQRMTRMEAFGHVVTEDEAELESGDQTKFHLSFEKTEAKSLGVGLGVQLEFLRLLKLTLLSYDFTYSFDKSLKLYLDFKNRDLDLIENESLVGKEIRAILRTQDPKINVLKDFVVSEEKRESQLKRSKYTILLKGGVREAKTQQVEIVKDNKIKRFFKHYFENIKYKEDLFSRLFSGFIYAVLNMDVGASKTSSETKRVTMEYEGEADLLALNESIDVGIEEKLSVTLTTIFKSNKTVGTFGEKYKERALFYLDRFSGVDPLASSMLKSDHLRGPLTLQGKYQLGRDGLMYLNRQSITSIYNHLEALCGEYPKSGFFNFRNLFDHCERSLQKVYLNYYTDLHHDKVTSDDVNYCQQQSKKYWWRPSKKRAFLKDCLANITYKENNRLSAIPLFTLKDFLDGVQSKSYSKVDYYNLFGVQNIFFYGSLEATTEDERFFTTHFHEGAFKGLGLIDHYMRLENMRFPASVVID